MAKVDHWMGDATKNAHGQFRAKAKKAGRSTRAYAEKEKAAKGRTGEQARLALALMSAHHAAKLYPKK